MEAIIELLFETEEKKAEIMNKSSQNLTLFKLEIDTIGDIKS